MRKKRIGKRLLLLFVSTLVLFYVHGIVQILLFSADTPFATADVAIVLGAGTHKGKLSPVYRERMNHAIRLYHAGKLRAIVCTGGYGEGEKQSDAQAAYNYARMKKVAPENLFLEERSTITKENVLYAYPIAKGQNWDRIIIVSDPLHMKRAMNICEHYNIKATPSATTSTMYQTWRSQLPSLLYEAFFLSLDKLRFLYANSTK